MAKRKHSYSQNLQAQLAEAEIFDAVLEFSLKGDCPNCGEHIDLMDGSYAAVVRAFAKSGNMKNLQDAIADCTECGQALQLDIVI